MKIRIVQTMLWLMLALVASQARAGYWMNPFGEVVRNSYGECWHTGSWAPEMAIIGCDGKVAEAPVPMTRPEPPPAPPSAATAPAEATVNFGFDRADLDADAMAAIDTLIGEARSHGGIQAVRLKGHADRIGTEDYNLDLSLRRAGSVSDYLVQRAGVDPQAIEIGGKGESEPLVGCEGTFGAAAIRCLAPNRRVEVMLDLIGH